MNPIRSMVSGIPDCLGGSLFNSQLLYPQKTDNRFDHYLAGEKGRQSSMNHGTMGTEKRNSNESSSETVSNQCREEIEEERENDGQIQSTVPIHNHNYYIPVIEDNQEQVVGKEFILSVLDETTIQPEYQRDGMIEKDRVNSSLETLFSIIKDQVHGEEKQDIISKSEPLKDDGGDGIFYRRNNGSSSILSHSLNLLLSEEDSEMVERLQQTTILASGKERGDSFQQHELVNTVESLEEINNVVATKEHRQPVDSQQHYNQMVDGQTLTINESYGKTIVEKEPVTEFHTMSRDIVQQVVNQATISQNNDSTRLEIQLHPEHLGRLMLQLIEEKGMITARFHVANQIVKKALEDNFVVLRQHLEQEGIVTDKLTVDVYDATSTNHFDQSSFHHGQNSYSQTGYGKREKNHGTKKDGIDSYEQKFGSIINRDKVGLDFTA